MEIENEVIDNFMYELRRLVNYWHKIDDRSEKEKMEGLVLSILIILDGSSGQFNGDINKIAKNCKTLMLHNQFFKK